MERALFAFVVSVTASISSPQAMEPILDVEGECRSIAEADQSGCRCLGLYFANRFGPEEGVVALHLVGRSYVPAPLVSAAALYERFGADTLNSVAQRILKTHDEVIAYCPFSTHVAE
jgi:hypothetical protein